MKISPEIRDSIELRFSEIAREMNAKGERIISLGLGEPSFPTPSAIIKATHQAMLDGMTRYSNPLGLPSLCRRIAEKLETENKIEAMAQEIIVTPGAKMALSLALSALLRPGDEIINITPCYPSYVSQIKIAEPNCVLHNVDLHKHDLSLDVNEVAAVLNERTRVMLINFPHNPTGRMLSAKELDTIANLLVDHDCYIISDEIYEQLNHSGARHQSLAARPELRSRVLTINGFSKAYSMTGWRIGYMHVPDPAVMKIVSRLQQHLNTNTAAFIQVGALVAMDLPMDFLVDYNSRLAINNTALGQAVADTPGLQFTPSEGGLFGFLDISGTGLSSDSFASGFLESHGVALTPGQVFSQSWDDHVRISLATDCDSFNEGMVLLRTYVRELACK